MLMDSCHPDGGKPKVSRPRQCSACAENGLSLHVAKSQLRLLIGRFWAGVPTRHGMCLWQPHQNQVPVA